MFIFLQAELEDLKEPFTPGKLLRATLILKNNLEFTIIKNTINEKELKNKAIHVIKTARIHSRN